MTVLLVNNADSNGENNNNNNNQNNTAENAQANKSSEAYKAPDGGWGWIIVASSLLIHVIMDGITYSLGTYLTIFTQSFGVSHAEASFVHSLLPAITLICGK